MRVLNRHQMHTADRLTIDGGTSSFDLMARAGEEAARLILERWPDESRGRITIFAGPGNNGGDGFVVARILSEHAAAVRVYFLGRFDRLAGDARRHADSLSPHLPIVALDSDEAWQRHRMDALNTELIVDALFGTGLSRPLDGLAAAIVGDVNGAGLPIASLDLPSGLSADRTDVPGPAVRATMTVTFATPKLPLVVTPACEFAGGVIVADIGIRRSVIDALPGPRVEVVEPITVSAFVRPRVGDSHKGTYGHVIVVGGSRGKIGAPVLTARAALRSGAGLVTVATPESCWQAVAGFTPEVMTEPMPETAEGTIAEAALDRLLRLKATVLAIGPGLGTSASTVALVRHLVARATVPLVLDADALNAIAGQPELLRSVSAPHVVITPHPGEMARLTQHSIADVQRDRLNVARSFASTYRVHVVLKGHRTVIATPEGDAYVNSTGNPGMATGGMGDVLTGVIAAWLAAGLPAREAAILGVFLHGLAGDHASDRGEVGLMASDLIERLPLVLAALVEPRTERA